MITRATLRLLGPLLGVIALTARAAEAPPAVKGEVLELPKYTVTNPLLLPPPESWRHADIPGFEVLTSAGNSDAQHFLRDFQRLRQVIDVVWPVLPQSASSVPTTLVLYGRRQKADILESAVTVVGDETLELQTLDASDNDGRPASAFFGDKEAACIVVELRGTGTGLTDPYRQFYREYVSYLISRLDVRTPPWLREGMARLFAGVDFTSKWIEFAVVGGPSGSRAGDFNTMLSRTPPVFAPGVPMIPGGDDFGEVRVGGPGVSIGAFPSLAEMLRADEQALRLDPKLRILAHEFVHMCLYGRGQQYQKPFFAYLLRTGGGPGSEAVFQECFKQSIAQMQSELVGYASFTDYKSIIFQAKKGQSLPTPPDVVLREATQAEVGRIKGQALVLAGRRDVARVALLAPYLRGKHDPDLLAALGLYEGEAGHPDRARKFLERAVQGGARQARAYLELARLRRAEYPAATGGPLTEAQRQAYLEPLRMAAALKPVLPEVYESMVREWMESPGLPPAADLALLERGALALPRNLKLSYDTAQLCAEAGLTQQAIRLAERGKRLAMEPADKDRFARLLSSLPAPGSAPRGGR